MLLRREPGLHPEECIGSGQVAQARKKEGKIWRAGLRGKDRPGLFNGVPQELIQGSPPFHHAVLLRPPSQFSFSRGWFAVQPQKSKGTIPAGSRALSPLPSSPPKPERNRTRNVR